MRRKVKLLPSLQTIVDEVVAESDDIRLRLRMARRKAAILWSVYIVLAIMGIAGFALLSFEARTSAYNPAWFILADGLLTMFSASVAGMGYSALARDRLPHWIAMHITEPPEWAAKLGAWWLDRTDFWTDIDRRLAG